MSTFVLLRIENDDEALTFLADMREYPGDPLLTPCQENTVVATVESFGDWFRTGYRTALGDVAEMLIGRQGHDFCRAHAAQQLNPERDVLS